MSGPSNARLDVKRRPGGSGTPREESEATEFALCLLMPRAFVAEWMKHREAPLSHADLERFADDFKVPLMAAAARLKRLGIAYDIAGPTS